MNLDFHLTCSKGEIVISMSCDLRQWIYWLFSVGHAIPSNHMPYMQLSLEQRALITHQVASALQLSPFIQELSSWRNDNLCLQYSTWGNVVQTHCRHNSDEVSCFVWLLFLVVHKYSEAVCEVNVNNKMCIIVLTIQCELSKTKKKTWRENYRGHRPNKQQQKPFNLNWNWIESLYCHCRDFHTTEFVC